MLDYEHENMSTNTHTNSYVKRQIPEICGSSAGFIVLIIVLAIITLVASTAVFLLLRDHEQSDEERVLRRRRHRSLVYSSSSAPPDISIRDKWNNLLDKLGIKRRDGWVQQQGDDDWDVGDYRPVANTGNTYPHRYERPMENVDGEGAVPLSFPQAQPAPTPVSTRTASLPAPNLPPGALPPVVPPPLEEEAAPTTFSTRFGEMRTLSGGTKFVESL